jgi:hypothetical protein
MARDETDGPTSERPPELTPEGIKALVETALSNAHMIDKLVNRMAALEDYCRQVHGMCERVLIAVEAASE